MEGPSGVPMPLELLNQLRDVTAKTVHLPHDDESWTALQELLDTIPVAALVADDNGRYVAANISAATLTGYGRRVLRGLSVWDLTPKITEDAAKLLWREFLSDQVQQGEYALLVHG